MRLSLLVDDGKANQDYEGHTDEQSVILWSRSDGQQLRLTVSEFREELYLGVRLWLLGIDDVWFPTKSGFSVPYNLFTTSKMFSALTELLSESEVLEEVMKHSKEAKD